jgi:hypothetical protein
MAASKRRIGSDRREGRIINLRSTDHAAPVRIISFCLCFSYQPGSVCVSGSARLFISKGLCSVSYRSCWWRASELCASCVIYGGACIIFPSSIAIYRVKKNQSVTMFISCRSSLALSLSDQIQLHYFRTSSHIWYCQNDRASESITTNIYCVGGML